MSFWFKKQEQGLWAGVEKRTGSEMRMSIKWETEHRLLELVRTWVLFQVSWKTTGGLIRGGTYSDTFFKCDFSFPIENVL